MPTLPDCTAHCCRPVDAEGPPVSAVPQNVGAKDDLLSPRARADTPNEAVSDAFRELGQVSGFAENTLDDSDHKYTTLPLPKLQQSFESVRGALVSESHLGYIATSRGNTSRHSHVNFDPQCGHVHAFSTCSRHQSSQCGHPSSVVALDCTLCPARGGGVQLKAKSPAPGDTRPSVGASLKDATALAPQTDRCCRCLQKDGDMTDSYGNDPTSRIPQEPLSKLNTHPTREESSVDGQASREQRQSPAPTGNAGAHKGAQCCRFHIAGHQQEEAVSLTPHDRRLNLKVLRKVKE